MKPITFALSGLLLTGHAFAEPKPLTEVERKALVEKLEGLRDKANEHASKRLGSASDDFVKAMKSEDAAIDLYLDCVEKVQFDDKGRKKSEFLDWKRSQKEKLKDEAFATALRYQLQWTVLTMRAAKNPELRAMQADDAMKILDAIYTKPLDLVGHVNLLGQPVNSTVFARAYNLSGYEVKDWPLSPLQATAKEVKVAGPYEMLIFPAYRKQKDAEKLKAAWEKRIRNEEIARGFWSNESDEEGNSTERELFLLEEQSALRWAMYVDLFKVGDERDSAIKMLELLEANLSHSKAREWEQSFRDLIMPPEGEG